MFVELSRRTGLVVLAVFLGFVQVSWAAGAGGVPSITIDASAAQGAPVAPLYVDRLIIRYKPAAGPGIAAQLAAPGSPQLAALSAAAGVSMQYVRAMSGGAHVLGLGRRLSEREASVVIQRMLKSNPNIEYVQPDYPVSAQFAGVPNDTSFPLQWNLAAQPGGIVADQAWLWTVGANNVVLAVLDTGILPLHPEFAGRILPGYDMVSDPMQANDGNGRDPDPTDPGDWSSAGQCYPGWPGQNSSWHGTHVAGIMAATGNNGVGIAGVDWTARILPVRILGRCGGRLSDMIDGIYWAAGLPVAGVPANPNKADVINLSLGGTHACSPAEQQAIDAAINAGVTVVAAAGNYGQDASTFAPANCNGVIAVGAINPSGDRASYSNFGPRVDVSAPGGDSLATGNPADGILSTGDGGTTVALNDGALVRKNGTSMAAPHVSGIIGLMQAQAQVGSVARKLTPLEVREILHVSTNPFPAGTFCANNPWMCGSGMIDAGAALSEANFYTPGSLSWMAPLPPFMRGVSSAGDGKIVLSWEGYPDTRTYEVHMRQARPMVRWIKRGKRRIKRINLSWTPWKLDHVVGPAKPPAYQKTDTISGRMERLYEFQVVGVNPWGKKAAKKVSAAVLRSPSNLKCRLVQSNPVYEHLSCAFRDRSNLDQGHLFYLKIGKGKTITGSVIGKGKKNQFDLYLRKLRPGVPVRISVAAVRGSSYSKPSNVFTYRKAKKKRKKRRRRVI